jgi:23S rRNA (cytosine1962-C5)-methyltransferase
MSAVASEPTILRTSGWADYALLDSGDGRKLERYGRLRVIRPEPQCLWRPRELAAWAEADAEFDASDEEEAGAWRLVRPLPDTFPLSWEAARFKGRLTAFRTSPSSRSRRRTGAGCGTRWRRPSGRACSTCSAIRA